MKKRLFVQQTMLFI